MIATSFCFAISFYDVVIIIVVFESLVSVYDVVIVIVVSNTIDNGNDDNTTRYDMI